MGERITVATRLKDFAPKLLKCGIRVLMERSDIVPARSAHGSSRFDIDGRTPAMTSPEGSGITYSLLPQHASGYMRASSCYASLSGDHPRPICWLRNRK